MGLSYGWLLSATHDVTLYARPGRAAELRDGCTLGVTDLRSGEASSTQHRHRWTPTVVTDIGEGYDAALVMVDRRQLADVVPLVAPLAGKTQVVFMLNHWDLRSDVEPVFHPGTYGIGFPSQVGGGRRGTTVEVTVFPKGTMLGTSGAPVHTTMATLRAGFEAAGLHVKTRTDMLDWLKIHYLQQAVNAGAVLTAGSYRTFVEDRPAVAAMVDAYREGVAVCRRQGVRTHRVFPAPLFSLPRPLVATLMGRMLRQPTTANMVEGHMGHGLDEWVTGYLEVLADGQRAGLDMAHWRTYQPAVQECVHSRPSSSWGHKQP